MNVSKDGLEHELELSEFVVTDRKSLPGRGILYSVESAVKPPCPACKFANMTQHGSSVKYYHDLPKFGRRVVLKVTKRRYICPECGTTTTDVFKSLADGAMTNRLREYIKAETLFYPMPALCKKYDLPQTTVYRLFNEKIKSYEGYYIPMMPSKLCIAAMQSNAGGITLFIDPSNGHIIEVSADQKQLSVRKKLHNFFHVEDCGLAIIDLHDNYLAALQAVIPKAVVITDKVFIQREFLQVYRKTREEICQPIKASKNRIFRIRASLLDPPALSLGAKKQKELTSLLDQFPELRPSYTAKEAFLKILEMKDKGQAVQAYHDWQNKCRNTKVKFDEFWDMAESWKDVILNTFDYEDNVLCDHIRSAEALAMDIDKESGGYSFEALRGKLVYRWKEDKPTDVLYDLDALQE